MQVLMLRHGYADSVSYDDDDYFRSLTAKGIDLAEKAARGLCSVVPGLDLIATSPLKRARQTAEIFGRIFQLQPGDIKPHAFLADSYLTQYFDKIRDLPGGTVLCVGHMPAVSRFVRQALPTRTFRRAFSPTAVAILEFSRSVLPRKAVLRGFYTGEELALLASAKCKDGSH